MANKILITPRSLTVQGIDHVAEFEALRDLGYELVSGPAGRLPTETELMHLVPDVVGWIAGVEKVSAAVLAAAHRLRVISRNGVGCDSIDVEAAERLGINIALARGSNARGVAELAITQILSCLREVPGSNTSLHGGGWHRALGREMPDTVVGIVGFGAIGRLVAQLVQGLGASVLAYDPYAAIEPSPTLAAATLPEIFSNAHAVTLHAPPTSDGTPLVTRELLSLMAPGSILVNTARSSLVEDPAVLGALESGQLAYYAVDAFDTEPPLLTPLLNHPHTVLTPHLGGYTGASIHRATEEAVTNLITRLKSLGEP